MKMKTVELTVGLFMVAAILSLLMLALQVSGLSDFFHEDTGYKIAVEFNNIGGLKPRAKVSIAGVVVGRVVRVVLEPNSFNAKVEIAIDPRKIEKLPIDTRASIMTSGLLGDNYVALTPGFSESEFLKNGSIISVDNTDSAIVLEQLISKFVANQVSPTSESPASPASPASTGSNATNEAQEKTLENNQENTGKSKHANHTHPEHKAQDENKQNKADNKNQPESKIQIDPGMEIISSEDKTEDTSAKESIQ